MKKGMLFGLMGCMVLLSGCFSFWGSEEEEKVPEEPKTETTLAQEFSRFKKASQIHPDSSAWKCLFDKDLKNANYTKGVWSVDKKGVLSATKDEAIWTTRDYADFILDLEYMCDPAANSGVLLHCSDTKNWVPNAVEVQILDDNHQQWINDKPTNKNGGLYGHCAPRVNNSKPAGAWNRMTIMVKGKQILVAVNNEVTIEADLAKWTDAKKNPDGSDIPPWLSRPWADLPVTGKIGLQGKHGCAGIHFRSVKIREL